MAPRPSSRLDALPLLLLLAAFPVGGLCTCALSCGDAAAVGSLVPFTLSGASPSGFFESPLACAWACAALPNATSAALFYSLTISTGKCTCFNSCDGAATFVTPSYRGLVSQCGPRRLPPMVAPPSLSPPPPSPSPSPPPRPPSPLPPRPSPPPSPPPLPRPPPRPPVSPPSPRPPIPPPAPLPFCPSPPAPTIRILANSQVGSRYAFLVCNFGPIGVRNLQLTCPPALQQPAGITSNCTMASVVPRGTTLESCISFTVRSTRGLPSFSVVGNPFSTSSTFLFRPTQPTALTVGCSSFLLTLPVAGGSRAFPVYSYRCVITNTGSPVSDVKFTCINFSPVTCSGITVACALPSGAVVPTGKNSYSFQFETAPGAITFSGVSFTT